MVHLRSEIVPNDATSFCAIFCRFLLFMQFWETMIETANSSLQKECTSKKQHRNSSFKIWWFQLFAVSLRHTNKGERIMANNEYRKLPIGIQSFNKIREENYLYVDKTDIIWDLAN